MTKPKPESATPWNIVAYVLEIAAAAILGYAAWGKFSGADQAVEIFSTLQMEPGGRILIGVLEGIAAILLLIPASGILGAALGSALMTGALIAHTTVLGIQSAYMAAIVLVLCGIILFLRRHQSEFFNNMFDR